jgi:hypothetical protein
MAQPSTVETRLPRRGRARTRRFPGGPSPRPRLSVGRLALLVLVLVAASFYLGPLREFFAQQDRFQQKTVALAAARADNTALKREVELLKTDSYIAQRSQLVEPGTQVFVIKGLQGRAEEDAARADPAPTASSISVLDRVEDLWRTLLQ